MVAVKKKTNFTEGPLFSKIFLYAMPIFITSLIQLLYGIADNIVAKYFDMGDLAGLIAPRPFIAINGLKDDIFPIDSAKEQAEVARAYYAAADAEHNLRHITGPEGHRFYAALGWPVFDELTGWKEN